MILSKEVEIRITPSNIKHFNSLGYKNLKCKNKEPLSLNSVVLQAGSGH